MIAVLYPSSFSTSAMVTSLCARPVVITEDYVNLPALDNQICVFVPILN